ncbi:hypothetical protein [Cystobacter fuscus]|uniref:hypothetical protein n=1 Tax=Cystobacter fuscus TaxID=43 RepID=UPI002B2852EB|nr:hypothetical protein F0U63_05335 [Cystobacter fuscus]
MSTMPLTISGLGLVTSVGHSVEGACAAIRANITRPRPVDGMLVWDADAQEEVPLTGHPIVGLTDGFQGIGRWFRLGRLALLDMLRYAGLVETEDSFWRTCGFILCTPAISPARFAFPIDEVHALASRLPDAFGLPVAASNIVCLPTGHGGPLQALHLARQKVSFGAWHRAVVLAVDSLLDETSLRWLHGTRRLKTPEYAVGLIPGEAAACILVEGPRRLSQKPEATLQSVALSEPASTELPATHQGLALATAVREAIAGTQGRPVGDILGNLNGEELRAMAWGTARVRIPRETLAETMRETWTATSLGDVGAASAAVSLCVAVRSFVRGYSRNGAALVWSLSDDGAASACLVRKLVEEAAK